MWLQFAEHVLGACQSPKQMNHQDNELWQQYEALVKKGVKE